MHEMKWLKAPEQKRLKPSPLAGIARHKNSIGSRKRKQRKPLWRRALDEVWDEIEDFFD